jgi:hypothetical protein
MTALKEVLQDRIDVLTLELDKTAFKDDDMWEQGYLYRRREDLIVCLSLVEKLQLEEEHPLRIVPSITFKPRTQPLTPEIEAFEKDAEGWGRQQRHDWPNSTFAGQPWDWEKQELMNQDDEAEPGVARHDPDRC